MTPSNHPPLPPTTEDDLIARLRLLRSRRVGPATYRRLIGEHGSPQAALEALPQVARNAGETDYQICPLDRVMAELGAARRVAATLIPDDHPDYPNDLNQIDDAPPLLWSVGNRALLHAPKIALVGARNASSLGTRMAKSLAKGLA